MNEETWREFNKKKLCFSCKDPWELSHICMCKGKFHYIEVVSDEEDDDDDERIGKYSSEPSHTTERDPLQCIPKGVTIATISIFPRYYTFRIRGTVQGKRIMTLVDGGATHNFIDVSLVNWGSIPVNDFEGFDVVVADGYNMMCTYRICVMELTLDNYTLIGEFYIMDLQDTHVVLVV